MRCSRRAPDRMRLRIAKASRAAVLAALSCLLPLALCAQVRGTGDYLQRMDADANGKSRCSNTRTG